jgi:hypothetical protein
MDGYGLADLMGDEARQLPNDCISYVLIAPRVYS